MAHRTCCLDHSCNKFGPESIVEPTAGGQGWFVLRAVCIGYGVATFSIAPLEAQESASLRQQTSAWGQQHPVVTANLGLKRLPGLVLLGILSKALANSSSAS
jgi:hypothetical protein